MGQPVRAWIATVRGQFNEFEGMIEAAEDDPSNSHAWGTVKVASIDTGNTVEGAAEDPWGNERVGISIRGVIDRTDFGLTWQQTPEAGGLLVGEEVKVLIDVSAVRA